MTNCLKSYIFLSICCILVIGGSIAGLTTLIIYGDDSAGKVMGIAMISCVIGASILIGIMIFCVICNNYKKKEDDPPD